MTDQEARAGCLFVVFLTAVLWGLAIWGVWAVIHQ